MMIKIYSAIWKQTDTTIRPWWTQLFAPIIDCTAVMETESQLSRDLYEGTDQIWFYNHLWHATTKKYDNNGKGGYFGFDDDNKISFEYLLAWWRHQMETFSAFLAICAGNSPVTREFPAQRPVTRNFDVFFDLCLNKRLSKQSRGWWFETLSRPLWPRCNGSPKLHFRQT